MLFPRVFWTTRETDRQGWKVRRGLKGKKRFERWGGILRESSAIGDLKMFPESDSDINFLLVTSQKASTTLSFCLNNLPLSSSIRAKPFSRILESYSLYAFVRSYNGTKRWRIYIVRRVVRLLFDCFTTHSTNLIIRLIIGSTCLFSSKASRNAE